MPAQKRRSGSRIESREAIERCPHASDPIS
jgi:hypothetical protein